MTEWRLFDEGTTPFVSTYEFHKDREAAPHIDQAAHQPRLYKTIELVKQLHQNVGIWTVCDLGAGDGGMIAELEKAIPSINAYGYDFQPANVEYAQNVRKVKVFQKNFLTDDDILIGDVVTCTEVIEHLHSPHEFLNKLSYKAKYLICSSPSNETDLLHCAEHAWAFDILGYQVMLAHNGWEILEFHDLWPFQLYLCKSRTYVL